MTAVPDDLAVALADARVRELFERLSPSHQQEYVSWVEDAKREETRKTRVGRTVELLKEGVETPK